MNSGGTSGSIPATAFSGVASGDEDDEDPVNRLSITCLPPLGIPNSPALDERLAREFVNDGVMR
jgi:hypothetical protein